MTATRADDVRRVRTLLDDADFDGATVRELLGSTELALLERRDTALHARKLPSSGALSLLIRLFLLDRTEPLDTARAELGDAALASLERLDLAEVDDGSLRAAMRLVPHQGLVTASDLPARSDHADYVPGLHRPSALLAHLTVRRPVARALDVGTGLGFQALLASRHADHVVATDINRRALRYAELNCELNGVTNVELRHGSYLDPVQGERFDLVVANPPYVISPESRYLYRDSGLSGDTVSASLARATPDVLTEGGFATLLVSWADRRDGRPAPESWVTERACDAWLLHTGTQSALTTALTWNRDQAGDPSAFDRVIDDWLAYYDQEGIDAVAYGALVLRRTSGTAGWFEALPMFSTVSAAAGPHLERLFAGVDHLGALPEGNPDLSQSYVVRSEAQVHEVRSPGGDVEEAELRLVGGLPLTIGIDRSAMALLDALRPDRTLADAFAVCGNALGLDRAEVAVEGWPVLRSLIRVGVVEPASNAP